MKTPAFPFLFVWALAFAPFLALGENFTVLTEQSTITISGTSIGGIALQEQGPGSLSTRFEGIIRAEVGESIRFTGGSTIVALTNGSWRPLPGGETGSEPANYGLKADAGLLGQAQAAARRVAFDVTSDEISLSGTTFNSSTLVFSFLTNAQGSLDYSISGFFPQKGSEALAGYATNNVTATATLTTVDNIQTLTLPIRADFLVTLLNDNDTRLTVSGQVVATRSLTPQDSGFDTWADSHFPGNLDPSVSGPGADPDGDSLPNFVEYALALDPKSASGESQVEAGIPPETPGQVRFQYVRAKGVSGTSVYYVLRSFPDMAPITAQEQVTDLGGGKEQVTLQVPVGVETGPRLYVLTVGSM